MICCWMLGIHILGKEYNLRQFMYTHTHLSTNQSIYKCFDVVNSKVYSCDPKCLYEGSVDTLRAHLYT